MENNKTPNNKNKRHNIHGNKNKDIARKYRKSASITLLLITGLTLLGGCGQSGTPGINRGSYSSGGVYTPNYSRRDSAYRSNNGRSRTDGRSISGFSNRSTAPNNVSGHSSGGTNYTTVYPNSNHPQSKSTISGSGGSHSPSASHVTSPSTSSGSHSAKSSSSVSRGGFGHSAHSSSS